MDPIAYNLVDPNEAILGGLRLGVGLDQIAQQRQQQQQAQEAAQQQQRVLMSLATNPNAGHADYAAVMTAYPSLAENLGKAFKVKDEAEKQNWINFGSRVYSASLTGNNDLAIGLLRDRAKADPNNAQHWNTMADLFQQSPKYARTLAAVNMAGLMGPDKFKEGFTGLTSDQRAMEEQPAKLIRAKADLDKVREEVAASKAKTVQAAQQYALDVDKFNLDFDKTVEELKQKRLNGGITLSPGMEKSQADSVGTALTARAQSNNAATLSQSLKAANPTQGAYRWLAEKAKDITGQQDAISTLRRDYARIRNQGLLSDLPPGPASDRDISTMMQGFPSENASVEQLSTWLDSFAKVQNAIAQKEEAKADWISAVGALKTAPRDIEVMGVRVPAGTSFLDFIKRGVKPEAAQPGAKTNYLQKYGR